MSAGSSFLTLKNYYARSYETPAIINKIQKEKMLIRTFKTFQTTSAGLPQARRAK